MKPALELLGDQGVLARCENEQDAILWTATVRTAAVPWILDVVQAYTTVAVYHDPRQIRIDEVVHWLEQLPVLADRDILAGHLHEIPCCYERGPDLDAIARHTGLSCEEVIRLHHQTEYTVYAIGFCPGFPYMGYLDPVLCGVPRLPSPRLRVEPGSVGLTGRQTGIYTEPRPGGWSLIGQTPLELVHVADGYFPLRTGDRVRFVRIDEIEFQRLLGLRL